MTYAWIAISAIVAMVVLAIIGRRQYVWTVDDTGRSVLNGTRDPYWLRCLDALDIFANVLLGGYEGETISARCGRWSLVVHGQGVVWHWIAAFILKWLNVIQPDHGQQAMAGALGRSQRLAEIEAAALRTVAARG